VELTVTVTAMHVIVMARRLDRIYREPCMLNGNSIGLKR